MHRISRVAAMVAISATVALLAGACGGSDDEGGDDAGQGSIATTAGDDAGPVPTVAGGTGSDQDDAVGEGTVVVDGTSYSFTVSQCIEVGGTINLGGDGEANVALSAVGLIVQLPSTGQTFSVSDFEATVDGDTVSGSGTGSNLAESSLVPVEMTATCGGL